jgi:hypothetical protein
MQSKVLLKIVRLPDQAELHNAAIVVIGFLG